MNNNIENNEVLSKIKLLTDLANSLQNESLKEFIVGLPSGDYLYSLFTQNVMKEIDNIMKTDHKDDLEVANSVNNLKQSIEYLNNIITELNNNPLLGILNILNRNISGNIIANNLSVNQEKPKQTPSNTTTRQRGTNHGLTY